jgi:hypothetical protein
VDSRRAVEPGNYWYCACSVVSPVLAIADSAAAAIALAFALASNHLQKNFVSIKKICTNVRSVLIITHKNNAKLGKVANFRLDAK